MRTYFAFRQNDTSGAVVLTVPRGLASDIATAAATFSIRTREGWSVLTDGVATISGVVTAADGSKGATFTYPNDSFTAGEPGIFYGTVTVIYPSGRVETVTKGDDLWWSVTPDYAELSAAEEETVVQGDLQTQAAHGFAVKDVVRFDSGTGAWAKAQANADDTLAMGVVLSVPSASQFRVAYLGPREVTLASHGYGAAGTKLYLSQATAGATITSEPATGIIQQYGAVKDANTLILWPNLVRIA